MMFLITGSIQIGLCEEDKSTVSIMQKSFINLISSLVMYVFGYGLCVLFMTKTFSLLSLCEEASEYKFKSSK